MVQDDSGRAPAQASLGDVLAIHETSLGPRLWTLRTLFQDEFHPGRAPISDDRRDRKKFVTRSRHFSSRRFPWQVLEREKTLGVDGTATRQIELRVIKTVMLFFFNKPSTTTVVAAIIIFTVIDNFIITSVIAIIEMTLSLYHFVFITLVIFIFRHSSSLSKS